MLRLSSTRWAWASSATLGQGRNRTPSRRRVLTKEGSNQEGPEIPGSGSQQLEVSVSKAPTFEKLLKAPWFPPGALRRSTCSFSLVNLRLFHGRARCHMLRCQCSPTFNYSCAPQVRVSSAPCGPQALNTPCICELVPDTKSPESWPGAIDRVLPGIAGCTSEFRKPATTGISVIPRQLSGSSMLWHRAKFQRRQPHRFHVARWQDGANLGD